MLKVSNGKNVVKVSVSSGNKEANIKSLGNSSEYYSNLSKNWAISDEMVQGIDYSSKYYAEQSRNSAETGLNNLILIANECDRQIALIETQKSEIISQANQILAQSQENINISNNLNEFVQNSLQDSITGLAWVSFLQTDWVQSGNVYQLELDIPIVISVYNYTKSLISNVDTQVTQNNCILTALEPFSGFVVTAKNNIEDEDNNEFTEEELEDLVISDWDDIS